MKGKENGNLDSLNPNDGDIQEIDAEEGIEFVIQELPEAVVKMTNSLRNGQFLTSRYKPIKWDPSINGDISSKGQIGYSHSQLARVYEGEYGAKTIIVDKATFLSGDRSCGNRFHRRSLSGYHLPQDPCGVRQGGRPISPVPHQRSH